MDRTLNPMTSGLLRNRKEDTERHREEGDKKMEGRLGGCSNKARTPRLTGSPQKLGDRPEELLTQMKSGVFRVVWP